MTETTCLTCAYTGDIRWTDSNTSIGIQVGCSEGSVRRHRIHMGSGTHRRVRAEWEVLVDGKVQTLRSYRVTEDETPLLKHEDLLDALTGYSFQPAPSLAQGESELLVVADAQIGKAMEHAGGTRETLLRNRGCIDRAISRYALQRPAELFLADGGDGIENCFNTSSQLATNDLTVPDQIKTFRRMMLENIKRLLPYTDQLYYVAVPSNHGEARTAMKSSPWSSDADWGLHIQDTLEEVCIEANLPVKFIRPDPLEETAVYTTLDGTKVAMHHGHQAGTQTRVGAWVTGQDHGRRVGWDADIWVLNHFHNPYFLTTGNGRSILGTPSIEPGSLWYAKKTGESSKPGMMAVTLANGSWSNYAIL